MSWLGSGISQITGQISNFTKEVLTEGTEEVDDHATELRLSKSKVQDLEGQNAHHKAELERIRKLNEELLEKLHTSELHSSALSNEYRSKLQHQEEEVKTLKQQHNEMLDMHSKLVVSSGPTLSHSASAPALQEIDIGADEHDFDDVISSQHEINQLRQELQRLSAECRHWRTVASSQSDLSTADGETADTDLRQRLQELEGELRSTIERHQSELAELQDVHREKVASVKRQAKDEVARLEAELAQQHQLSGPSPLQDDVAKLTESLRETEEEKEQLSLEVEQLQEMLLQFKTKSQAQQDDTKLARLIQEPSSRLSSGSSLGSDLSPLSPHTPQGSPNKSPEAFILDYSEASMRNRNLERQVESLEEQLEHLEKEQKQERSRLEEQWSTQKQDLERTVLSLRVSLQQREEQIQALTSQKELFEEAERMKQEAERAAEETTSINDLSLELEHFQKQVDLLTEGNSLLEKHRNTLLEEKEQIGAELAAQIKYSTDLESQLEENNNTIEALSQESAQRAQELTQVKAQLNECRQELLTQNSENSQSSEQVESAEEPHESGSKNDHQSNQAELDLQAAQLEEASQKLSAHEVEIARLTALLEEKFNELDDLAIEKEAVEASLEELDAQHQAALQQVMEKKDALQRTVEELQKQLTIKELSALGQGEMSYAETSLEGSKISEEDVEAEISRLRQQLHQSQLESSRLTDERDRSREELQLLKNQLEQGSHALNDLHMDKAELSKQVKKVEDELTAMREQKQQVQSRCGSLQEELNNSVEELATAKQLSAQGQGLQLELRQLQEQLETSQSHADQHQLHISQLQADLDDMQTRLDESSSEKANLSQQLHESWRASTEKAHLSDSLFAQVEELKVQLEAVQAQKEALKKQSGEAEAKHAEEIAQLQYHIQESEQTREVDASTLQQQHQQLLKASTEKDQMISALEQQCAQLKIKLEEQQSLICEKEVQLDALQKESASLHQSIKQHNTHMQELEAELAKLTPTEELCRAAEEEAAMLRQKLEAAEAELCRGVKQGEQTQGKGDSEVRSLQLEVTQLQDKVKCLESAAVELQQQVTLKESSFQAALCEQQQLKDDLSTAKAAHDSHSQALEQALAEKNEQLADLEHKLKAARSAVEEKSPVIAMNGTSSDVANGDVGAEDEESSHSTVVEVDNLRRIITQKDDVITELRNNNGSLLKMLEERCLASHGNKVLVEVHRLESDVRGLRTEKEQMMAVLQEKTRECSNLKTEVHRLMNVVSQSKAALAKMQEDSVAPPQTDVNQDMQKEAMKNLARIIRDKDVEIEALTQKNQTLLQVLQEGASDGGHTASLISDRDNLQQQLAMFQADREQIVAALTQKHNESLAYHSELQRLIGQHSQVKQAAQQVQEEYNNLKNQYEDKQQCLLKAQNELISYRQKYVEVDVRYKDLLQKQQKQQQQQQQQQSSDGEVTQDVMVSSEEYEELSQVVSRLQESMAHKDASLQDWQRQWDTVQNQLQEKQISLADCQKMLEERELALSELRGQLHVKEDILRQRDSELISSRKQNESGRFELSGLQSEVGDLKGQNERLSRQHEEHQQLLAQLKDANSRLSITIGERDLEVTSMNQRICTLNQLVTDKEGASEVLAETRSRLAESEALQRQAQLFQQERDQALGSLQAKQGEVNALIQQVEALSERETRLSRELERLRSHLLSIEEGYTLEALAAEEREKELRTRLAVAEEKALSSSTAVQSASAVASQQVESLQEQLQRMAEQRDEALMQLASAQETANQYATSLANLQMVLEQFTHEREHAQALEVERSRQRMEEAISERNQLAQQLTVLKTELSEAEAGLEAAHRLSEQLDRREEVIRALKEEVQLRENELTRAEDEVRALTQSNEGKVDKALVRNLFLGYFHSPKSKRNEVLQLMGKVLTFSPDEMVQIGLEGGGSWLGAVGGLFRLGQAPPSPERHVDKSFSELFVKFLEHESSPAPMMRLPAEEMARDTQQRTQQRTKPAFNPFAAPVSSTAHSTHSNMVSHPLMNPAANPLFQPVIAPSPSPVPSGAAVLNVNPRGNSPSSLTSTTRASPALISPATRASPGLTGGPVLAPQGSSSLLTSGTATVYSGGSPSLVGPADGVSFAGGSQRGSTNNSGHSTPASSSAILSSVLQQ